MPRRFPIFQFPNRPLIVTMLAAAVGSRTTGRLSSGATLISRAALLIWSAEELTGGANWFRRLLGAAGGGYAVATLRRASPVSPSSEATDTTASGR